ncbi:ATP-binding cassette transporter [Clonorchis sinensis]|uniref:ATP-binding cassette transporter n=1 Tax=Clonorchis sinensis TaxID=79923 RepID=G7YUF8_CLOSI|nr:ATP-binding cassette transporter [Clonorchis sinensis]
MLRYAVPRYVAQFQSPIIFACQALQPPALRVCRRHSPNGSSPPERTNRFFPKDHHKHDLSREGRKISCEYQRKSIIDLTDRRKFRTGLHLFNNRLLKTLRQSTKGFTILWLSRKTQSPVFRQPYVLLEPKLDRVRQIHSFVTECAATDHSIFHLTETRGLHLPSEVQESEHVDEAWQNVKRAMLAAFSAICPTSPIRPQDHWMSSRPLSMIDARKAIPAGNEYDGARKSLKRQIVKSLRKDRKLWWTSKSREMKKAFAREIAVPYIN